jgi:hypothetical protein
MTKDEIEQVQALFATLANCERIDESGEPNTLSLKEIQNIGAQGLNIVER